MELEFQNATIGLPIYGAITLIKIFAGKCHYRALKRHYRAPLIWGNHTYKKFVGKRCYRALKRHYRA